MNMILLALSASAIHASDLPKTVSAQVPAGYEVMMFKAGQLTNDGRIGYLVVVHRPVDTSQAPSPRPLLIFTQNQDGAFKLARRNDHVVMQADQGGQCDPFDDGEDGLSIKDRYFTVQNSVACGEHWTDYITFHYDAGRKDWLFHRQVVDSYDPLGNKPDSISDTKASKARPVTFEAWKPQP